MKSRPASLRSRRKRNNQSRRLHVERLEQRKLLAGVVSAAIGLQAEGEAAVERIVYLEDFESGTGGFTADNTGGTLDGLWHYSLGRSNDGLANHTPLNSMYYGLFETPLGGGRYDTLPFDHQGVLISPSIDLPGGTNTLMFNSFLGTRLPIDIDFVDVSVVSPGLDPVQLVSRADGSLIQTISSWQAVSVELPSQFSGKAIQLRFSFDTGDSVNVDPEGWYVDDIKITNLANNDLSVTKSIDDPTPNEGQQVTYTVTATNALDSDGVATGVVVTEILPSALTFVSASATEGQYDAGTGQWTGLELEKGEQQILTLVATVNAGTAGMNITNNVSIKGNEPDPDPDNDKDETETPVNSADLSTDKKANKENVLVGDELIYEVTVSNAATSNSKATGVVVTDIVPAGTTFVSASVDEGTYDEATGRWTGLELDINETQTLLLTVSVNPGTAGQILTNTVTVTATETDPDPDGNTKTITTPVNEVDLDVTKTVDDPTPNVGQSVQYEIVVSNPTGSRTTATGIVVEEILPPGLALDPANPPISLVGDFDFTNRRWTIDNLPEGESATLIVNAIVGDDTHGDMLANTACATFDQQASDPNMLNDCSTATITVNSVDLSVVKTVDDSTPDVGQSVTYSITVTNPTESNASATNIVVTDLLPPELTLDPAQPPVAESGTFNTDTLQWTIDELPVGESTKLTVVAIVGEDTFGTTLSNTACAEFAESASDPEDGNNCSTVTSTVNSVDLQITKAVDNPSPTEGDIIAYTITATNSANSNATATNINVAETLPQGMKILGGSATIGAVDQLTGQWSGFDLPIGQSSEMTLLVQIENTGAAMLSNIATGTADESDPDTNNNTGSANANVAAAAEFTLPISVFRPNGNASFVDPGPLSGATIQGFKFNDFDRDGNWDAGEPGRSGFEIFIDINGDGNFDPDIGEPLAVTQPSADPTLAGMYTFTGLAAGTYTIRQRNPFSAGTAVVQTLPSQTTGYTVTVAEGETVSAGFETNDAPNFGGYEFVPMVRPSDDLSGHLALFNGSDPSLFDVTLSNLSPLQTVTISNPSAGAINLTGLDTSSISGRGGELLTVVQSTAGGLIEPTFPLQLDADSNVEFLLLYDPAVRNESGDQVLEQFPDWIGQTPSTAHTFAATDELVFTTDSTSRFRVRLTGASTFDSDVFHDGAVNALDIAQFGGSLGAADTDGFDFTSDINTRCPNGTEQTVNTCSWALSGDPKREIGFDDFGTLNVEAGSVRTAILDLDADNSSGTTGSGFSVQTDGPSVRIVDSDAFIATLNSTTFTSVEVTLRSGITGIRATDRLELDTTSLPADVAGSVVHSADRIQFSSISAADAALALQMIRFATDNTTARLADVEITLTDSAGAMIMAHSRIAIVS